MVTPNRTTQETRDSVVIAGIEKDLATVTSLTLAGQTITPADLVKLVQSRIDAANAVAPAKAKWSAAVLAYNTVDKEVTPVLRALKAYLTNTYGSTSPILADFGFSPPKTAVKSPAVKTAAAEKALATRKARNTMGKVQKKAVKGNVTAVTITPVVSAPVAPAAPTTTPSGAAAPENGGGSQVVATAPSSAATPTK
jgi:hypothetical protein